MKISADKKNKSLISTLEINKRNIYVTPAHSLTVNKRELKENTTISKVGIIIY